MIFKELDPELAWKAIEGHENLLDPEARKLDAFYRQFSCRNCRSTSLRKEVDVGHAFRDPDTLVPRSLLRCDLCGELQDPHTGIVLRHGSGQPPPKEPRR